MFGVRLKVAVPPIDGGDCDGTAFSERPPNPSIVPFSCAAAANGVRRHTTTTTPRTSGRILAHFLLAGAPNLGNVGASHIDRLSDGMPRLPRGFNRPMS